MDEKLKRTLAWGVVAPMVIVGFDATIQCQQNNICAIENTELWHTHEREPVPTQRVMTLTLATASTGSTNMPIRAPFYPGR